MLITSHNVRPYHFLYGWSDYTIFQLDLLLRVLTHYILDCRVPLAVL